MNDYKITGVYLILYLICPDNKLSPSTLYNYSVCKNYSPTFCLSIIMLIRCMPKGCPGKKISYKEKKTDSIGVL